MQVFDESTRVYGRSMSPLFGFPNYKMEKLLGKQIFNNLQGQKTKQNSPST